MNQMTLRIISLAIILAIDTTFALAKPNVILIVCDDLNTDIEGFGGHPQSQTHLIFHALWTVVSAFSKCTVRFLFVRRRDRVFLLGFIRTRPTTLVWITGIKIQY